MRRCRLGCWQLLPRRSASSRRWSIPSCPDAAAKVWQQLGQGEIADAAKQSFLTDLAWGGLKAGTQFGEPAPLFPRAEKDAVTRMQNLEDENNKNAVEAASDRRMRPKRLLKLPLPLLALIRTPARKRLPVL